MPCFSIQRYFMRPGRTARRDVQRMVNLLQVSSAHGRAMEAVNRMRMCETVYPLLLEYKASGRLSATEIELCHRIDSGRIRVSDQSRSRSTRRRPGACKSANSSALRT
jgi:hypothetical protein